jgi:Flp pilus assembly protein TadG
MTRHARDDRGVATVEFALIVPTLLLLICGVIDFGSRYKTAALYNNAALVAARSVAINDNAATATTAANAAATNAGIPSGVTPTYAYKTDAGLTVVGCAIAADGTYPNVTVTITKSNVATATKLFGTTFSVTGKAVVRCAA